jgi:hypothetical protein
MARLTANADREGVLSTLASALIDEFGVEDADIWLYDPADGRLHRRAHAQRRGSLSEDFASISLTDDHLPIVRAIRQRAPCCWRTSATILRSPD